MKRWLLRIGIFVVLGIVITVAQAWAFAALDRYDHFGSAKRIRHSCECPEIDPLLDASVPHWRRTGIRNAMQWKWFDRIDTSVEAYREPVGFERWSFQATIYGWPYRAMAVEEWSFIKSGQVVTDHTSGVRVGRASMPLRVLWRGFAINALLASMSTFITWGLPYGTRRWIRFERGRCPDCAFDLRSGKALGCPECGWQRQNCPPEEGHQ